MAEEKEYVKGYIGFYINPELKKEFQIWCIRKNSDITAELKKYIEKTVKNHLKKTNPESWQLTNEIKSEQS